jgi:hypothetical protein
MGFEPMLFRNSALSYRINHSANPTLELSLQSLSRRQALDRLQTRLKGETFASSKKNYPSPRFLFWAFQIH